MLKTLTRLHTPELLHVLASMGHGDKLVLVVDCHFPAVSNARRLVRLDGADLPDMLSARLQLMPLDTFVKDPALRWKSPTPPILCPECRRPVSRRSTSGRAAMRPSPASSGTPSTSGRARRSPFAATGEQRTYGCTIVKKGVATG